MSTHARIGLLKEGFVVSSYVHYDGYPEHTGELLFNHYNTEEKIEELLSYGNISQLRKSIEETSFFSEDEDEKFHLASVKTIDQYEAYLDNYYVDFLYLFEDGKWLVKENE